MPHLLFSFLNLISLYRVEGIFNPASAIDLTSSLPLRKMEDVRGKKEEFYDGRCLMDDVLRDVRCMMAEGRCIISLFHSHLVSCTCAQAP